MSRFLNAQYAGLKPYVPGEQPKNLNLIKLNTNESPYPPSPAVLDALNRKETENLRLYSDPEGLALRKAIAENCNLNRQPYFTEEHVALGNGSDELLAFCFMLFQPENRKIYYPAISYGFYPVYAQVYHAEGTPVPLGADLAVEPADYRSLDGTIIIANPNAPTGIALCGAQIEMILQTNRDNLVIIDEAYVDFGAESAVSLIPSYDNLLVIRTFSKSRNLAGARIGFALGQKETIKDLNTLRFSFNPYNINRLSLRAGEEAMKDQAYFERCVTQIQSTRDWFIAGLAEFEFQVLPSKANFVFVAKEGIQGATLLQELRNREILVRHFEQPEIGGYIRITIGTRPQMEACLAALQEITGRCLAEQPGGRI